MRALVEKIIENAVDFHIHASPDPFTERSIDPFEAALQAKGIGMKGIVLKSHHYPTAPVACMLAEAVKGVEVIGSLALNKSVGGINPSAVEASAKMGAKVIWMPTTSAVGVRKRKGFDDGVPVVGNDGKPLAEVSEVLALIREYDLVLCTGHISEDEIIALFSEARKFNLKKIVVTHPLKVAGTSIALAIQRELADQGAYIEHCFGATFSLTGSLNPKKIVEAVKLIGVEKCIVSTDFGKYHKPLPSEGMRMMIATLLECGLSEKELHALVKTTPGLLLGL